MCHFVSVSTHSCARCYSINGYLGGAIATHVRIEDGFAPPLIMGVLVWLGLYLRSPRLRE